MELIDDEGRLFGAVNVVDALVVLLVVAVAVAGVAFVFGGGDSEPAPPDTETTYATLDLGVQESYIVEAIQEGDTYEPDGSSTLRVTDVHLTPQDGNARVALRVAMEGQVNDQESLVYAGAPLRLGRSLTIATDRYKVSGQLRDVGESDALAQTQQPIILSTTLDAGTAEAVTPGDEVRVAGRTAARIEEVTTYATGTTQRRVLASVTLDAHRQQGGLRFGGQPVRRGQQITLPTDEYVLDGQIDHVGDGSLGETTTRTVTLRMEAVREDYAEAIESGMIERTGDTTVARVRGVETEPSIIIAIGDDGTVNVVDHPVNRDVTITADLQLRETPTGLAFKGDQLRQGSTVVLDLGTVTVEAEVVTVER